MNDKTYHRQFSIFTIFIVIYCTRLLQFHFLLDLKILEFLCFAIYIFEFTFLFTSYYQHLNIMFHLIV